jgi:hypothetical protein
VEEALLQNALKGNATAQMFWLKNRYPEKWNDKRADERDPMEEVRAISDANRKAAEEQLKGEN